MSKSTVEIQAPERQISAEVAEIFIKARVDLEAAAEHFNNAINLHSQRGEPLVVPEDVEVAMLEIHRIETSATAQLRNYLVRFDRLQAERARTEA
jgi:hypothetical protein